MKQISYVLKEEVPLVAETEILVIGSGPGGLCAAVTAARRGRQVIMAEHYGSPGGMANVGEISPFMPNHCSGECLDRPLYVEWLNRMRAYRSLGEDIVILGAHTLEHTSIGTDSTVGRFHIVNREAALGKLEVSYYTYMKFKGCEQKVVILYDVTDADPRWRDPRGLYTAMSRAIHQLIILKKS